MAALRKWISTVLINVFAAAADQGPYQLADVYMGPNFFDSWDFFTQPDPSNGHVVYVDAAAARAEGMTRSSAESAYIGVDMKSQTDKTVKRRSVRIQSKATYNSGLFIVNVEHIPTGCGTWPAFWMYGEDANHQWPEWGEYDIIETLHSDDKIMTALHSNGGCGQQGLVQGRDFTQTWSIGKDGAPADNCDVNGFRQYTNQGCSQQGKAASAGQPFNRGGGGTFAGEWDPENGYIRQWFWPAGLVPPDVQVRRPDPSSWGVPDSYFAINPAICDKSHFQNMRLVFNVNLCGDLGSTYFADSCPAEAKTMTCEEYIGDPERMSEAFWFIRSLDIYQRGSAATTFFLADRSSSGNSTIKNAIVFGSVLVLVFGVIGVGLFLVKGHLTSQRGFTTVENEPLAPWQLHPGMYVPSRTWSGDTDGKRRARSQSTESGLSEWSRAHSRSFSDWSVGGV